MTEEEKLELMHENEMCFKSILNYKAHLIRAFAQNTKWSAKFREKLAHIVFIIIGEFFWHRS